MQLTTLGEIIIDIFPAEVGRRLVDVTAFYPKPGGAPANVAVAARRLGAETAFIGKVGDDAFGHYLIEVVSGQGVETRGMRVDEEAGTTIAVIALVDENTPEFVFYRNPGADQCLRPDELDTDLLRSSRAFHFGSLSLSDEPSRSATHEALRIAKDGGALISFDANYRPALWNSPEEAVEQIAAVIPSVHLLKVNEVEAELLVGDQKPKVGGRRSVEAYPSGRPEIGELAERAKALLAMGPELAVATLGPDGSYFHTAAGGDFIPPFPVEAVDAVGCGDAFIASVLTRLTATEDWRSQVTPDNLRNILRYANAVGALTATKQGVIPALPTATDVETFLAEHSDSKPTNRLHP